MKSTANRNESSPVIIALDYYDGAIEGFANEIEANEAFYFRIVAWDEGRDRRLFASTAMARDAFDEVLQLVSRSERQPRTSTIVPSWNFESPGEEKRANEILALCVESIRKSGRLILGSGPTDSGSRKLEYGQEIGSEISKTLDSGSVADLEGWLGMIGLTRE